MYLYYVNVLSTQDFKVKSTKILKYCTKYPITDSLVKSCELKIKSTIDDNSFQHDSNPCFLATGDFNHDEFLDIVVINSGRNSIGIFLNYGNGSFASQISLNTGISSRPLSVAVHDLNNDTRLDIAVANYDAHNIGIFLGYGNGTFASQIRLSTGASRPVSIMIGDLNNDYQFDIVIANNGTNNIGIFFRYKNGFFQDEITYSTGYDSLPISIAIADFNNDHNFDIVVANSGTDNIGVFLGYGNGNLTTLTLYSTGPQSNLYSVAINDFNSDGHFDIAVANSGTYNIGIFIGYGNGSFVSQMIYSIFPKSNPHSIVIGDFNNDNQMDIAVSNLDTDNIGIFIGYGNGSFSIPTTHSTGIGSRPLGMIVGDFDNNNQSDLAIANFGTNKMFVLIEYTMMQSQNPIIYSTGVDSHPSQIAIDDLNNDNLLDLVVVNSKTNNIGVFLGYGNGSFREQKIYSTGKNSRPFALVINDIDNDHRLDIIVANSKTKTIGILYGYGNGTFAIVKTYSTGNSSSPRGIVVGDFNNDNHVDTVFADYTNGSIGILLGYGNRTFGNLTKYSSGYNAKSCFVAKGDFNNDGQLDIAVVNYGTYNIGILFGLGNGTFSLMISYSTGPGSFPRMLTVGDINKDNYLDIIIANSSTNKIGIFFGSRNGSFNSQVIYSTGLGTIPRWISIADFNNNQSLDLVVANSNLNNIGVFIGNRYGYFGNQSTYSTGPGSIPYSIVFGDFNKDNRLDIAVANYNGNNVAILLGHPSEHSIGKNRIIDDTPILLGEYYANFSSQTMYSTGSASHPYSISFGQFNNDTQMDIVVANSGNENIGVLLQYDNGTFASELIYSIGIGSNPHHIIVDDFNGDNHSDVVLTNPRNDNIIVLQGNGNGTFSREIIYSTGFRSNPTTLAINNFNNDKYLDLVVTNKEEDVIGIFFGFNYTSFEKEMSYDCGEGASPTSVAIGDFNNDGYLDIVSTHYGFGNLGIFLGHGNGTFTPIMIHTYLPLSNPQSIAVSDFNNDNQLDITVVNPSISIILGYGNGTFAKPILYSISSGIKPMSIAVGDFNNDNYLDITTANNNGNSIGVFLGYGNGSFRNVITFSTGKDSYPLSVTVSDINNDNQLDIIVANNGKNSVGIFLGYGNGSFAEQLTFSTGVNSAPWYAIAGDFNNDGRLDLAVTNDGTNNVGILDGYSNGSFGNLKTYTTGVNSYRLTANIADFNNDNQLDIIVSGIEGNGVGILFGYGDGTFATLSIVSIRQGSIARSPVVADFNNDNRLDFTIADNGNDRIIVLLASGSQPFGAQTPFYVDKGSRTSSVTIGHFNNDNQLDIAFTNFGTNNIGILFGDGDRIFSNVTTYSTGDNSHPISLDKGDFNHDSITDIVVANSETNNIAVFIGQSNGNFSSFMSYEMGINSRPMSVAVGDFNRDSKMDIAVANYHTNNVCILFGFGNGTFTNQTCHSLKYYSRPNWISFKDLNNDGWEDIVVANYGIDNIDILWNLC